MFSFSSILSDAKNFLTNNLMIVIVVLLGLSVISQTIAFLFYPSIESLGPINALISKTLEDQNGNLSAEYLAHLINQLPKHEQDQLIPIAFSYLIKIYLIFLVTNLINISTITSLIFNLSYNQLTPHTLLTHIMRLAPQIILFMLLCIPAFIALFIIAALLAPLAMFLILLGSLLYMVIYALFLSVAIEPNIEVNFMKKVQLAFQLLKTQIRFILPITALWLGTLFILSALAGAANNNFILNIILNACILLLNFIVICYFYRLYKLTSKT